MRHQSLAHLSACYLWFALAISGVWSQLDVLGVGVWLLLVGSVGFALFMFRTEKSLAQPVEFPWSAQAKILLKDHKGSNIVFALMLPSLIALWLGWPGEFPFSGDHDHHAMAVLTGLEFWTANFWPIALSAVGLALAGRGLKRWWWPVVAMVALIGLSFTAAAPNHYFARYPASVYFLAAPVMALAKSGEWSNIANVLRLVNFLALPLGLLLLRPWIAAKPLRFGFLLFGLFYFWQKDVMYYSVSSYLEPWCAILVILAAELVIRADERRWLAVFLIGLAAMFKEQAILLLPFFWLASYGRFWRSSRDLKESIVTGVIAALPFVTYFFFRRSESIWRNAEALGMEQIFSAERMGEWLHRLEQQFGWSGLVPLAGLVAYALWSTFKDGERRWSKIWLLAGAGFQMAFFYTDGVSQPWTGYPRFHLLAFAILGIFWIELGERLKKPATKALVLGAILAGNVIPWVQTGGNYFYAAPRASFIEHYDSAHFVPIRGLVSQAEKDGILYKGASIMVNAPSVQFHPQSIGLGYRDLATKYRFVNRPDSLKAPLCSCSGEAYASMVFDLPAINMNAPPHKYERAGASKGECREAIRQSCRKVFEETLPTGEWVGTLGVGAK